jgi:DNA-binding transcriptional MerR regulator
MATAPHSPAPLKLKAELPPVPAKRYFTIGEVSDLCQVKQHVLRYWEQEFSQLKPMKRRGNRRYYQHHEVMLIRRIRALLYDEGFTISGARSKLEAQRAKDPPRERFDDGSFDALEATEVEADVIAVENDVFQPTAQIAAFVPLTFPGLRSELIAIRELLHPQ